MLSGDHRYVRLPTPAPLCSQLWANATSLRALTAWQWHRLAGCLLSVRPLAASSVDTAPRLVPGQPRRPVSATPPSSQLAPRLGPHRRVSRLPAEHTIHRLPRMQHETACPQAGHYPHRSSKSGSPGSSPLAAGFCCQFVCCLTCLQQWFCSFMVLFFLMCPDSVTGHVIQGTCKRVLRLLAWGGGRKNLEHCTPIRCRRTGNGRGQK